MSRSPWTSRVLLVFVLLTFPTNFAKTTGLLAPSNDDEGRNIKANGDRSKEKAHHLQKRTYDFSGFDWAAYLDGLYSPKGLPNQAAISTSLNGFRTVSYLASGKFLRY